MVFALSVFLFLPALPLGALPGDIGEWFHAPPSVHVRAESSGGMAATDQAVNIIQSWRTTEGGCAWDLAFSGTGPVMGQEVVINLPVLARGRSVFAATARGVTSLDAYPSLDLPPYGGHYGRDDFCVLPLISVLDHRADRGLTIALPPDTHLPHLQIEWESARLLRLRLAHRAVGKGADDHLSLLLYTHRADYRSALRCYSDDYPAYFRPSLPRGEYEGPFYYHHIQDAPDLTEQKAQGVRWIWTSFWFPYLGEMLPAEPEWEPYTYARWWSLGEMMTDAKINAFVQRMHKAGIGTYAYFNTTEYGGYGGALGDAEAAERAIVERFGDALVHDAAGNSIGTWEASKAMNPSSRYSYAAHLDEQVRRHLDRLPDIDGFCIDRLDWADVIDYGHSDGRTMLGGRPVEHLSGPVAEAVQRVCELAHQSGKRVFVNQFYRIDVLRDVDGICHEFDYARGLGYLAPYRPASAWHLACPPAGGMLGFEGQLKTRLLFAIFPQMIAHEFPISQQAAHPEGANMLEAYAPLFELLIKADQVLLPHCIEVTGPNEANLFQQPDGTWVAPVISRVRFLAEGATAPSQGTLTLRIPDADRLAWARVVTAEGEVCSVRVRHADGEAGVELPMHRTASVVTLSAGGAPPEPEARPTPPVRSPVVAPPALGSIESATLWLTGRHLGIAGPVQVVLNGHDLGVLEGPTATLIVPLEAVRATTSTPRLTLDGGCEGVWFHVEDAVLTVTRPGGRRYAVARFQPQTDPADMRDRALALSMPWATPLDVEGRTPELFSVRSPVPWHQMDRPAVVVTPAAPDGPTDMGWRMEISGTPYVWAESTDDPRVPSGRAECWHSPDELSVRVVPGDPDTNYVVTLFMVDFDRNGRAVEIIASGVAGTSVPCAIDREMMAAGAAVSFRVRGPMSVQIRKLEGYNVVLSAVSVL